MFDKIIKTFALKWLAKNQEKIVKGAGTAAAAWLAATYASQFGVDISPDQKTALEVGIAAVTGGLIVGITNKLKHAFPNGIGRYL